MWSCEYHGLPYRALKQNTTVFCKMALIYSVFIVFEEKKYLKILSALQFLHFVKCIYDRYCHNFFLVFNNINKALI